MTAENINGREVLREFINLYRENECLWDTKSKDYQNQGARLTAYTILLHELKKIDKHANILSVKNKINSMRTCYRHELRKIKESKESGAKGDDIYQPSLWYFHDLSFLLGDEAPEVKIKEDNINKMTDLRGCSRSFVKEFIKLYKKHECLWNFESDHYNDKRIKAKSYEELRVKWLEIDKNATLELVKKKINSMRTIFLANYKKMIKSKSLGPDHYFQPKLFYFDDLKFLINRNTEIAFEEDNINNESTVEDDRMNCELTDENDRIRSESPEEENERMRSESPEEENEIMRSESPVEYKLFENFNVEDLFFESEDNDAFNSSKKSNKENSSCSEEDEKVDTSEDEKEEIPKIFAKSSKSNIQNMNEPQKRNRNCSESEDEKEDISKIFGKSSKSNIQNRNQPQKRNRNCSDSEDEKEDISKIFGKSSKSNIQNKVQPQKWTRNCSDYEYENEDITEIASRSSKRKKSKPIPNGTIKYTEQKIDEEDEFEIYAKYIASEMRSFPSDDLIFIKKLFNDTLFEAKIGNAKCMRIMSITKLQVKSDKKRN